MKKRLLNGELIQLTNGTDIVNIWFQPITKRFCLEINAVVVKATKVFKPIQDKLNQISNLKEI